MKAQIEAKIQHLKQNSDIAFKMYDGRILQSSKFVEEAKLTIVEGGEETFEKVRVKDLIHDLE